jgi:hypothetical protein
VFVTNKKEGKLETVARGVVRLRGVVGLKGGARLRRRENRHRLQSLTNSLLLATSYSALLAASLSPVTACQFFASRPNLSRPVTRWLLKKKGRRGGELFAARPVRKVRQSSQQSRAHEHFAHSPLAVAC